MYYLAACDNEGKCLGFVTKWAGVSTDPDKEIESLAAYVSKAKASERALQINLGHALLPNGAPYRVTVVKG